MARERWLEGVSLLDQIRFLAFTATPPWFVSQDALGMHISEETTNKSHKKVWQTTIATVLSKLFFGLTFLIPFFIFELSTGVYVSIVYGLILIGGFSYYIGKKKAMTEHLILAIIVIIATHYVGKLIGTVF